MLNVLTIGTLIEEVVEPLRDQEVEVVVTNEGSAPAPLCVRNPGILYGLGNLVENAVDFAKTKVRIDTRWTPLYVSIAIQDDGPGFEPRILDRVGDPYVSGDATVRRVKADPDAGLGLGLFIAKTLLERSGAMVETGNVEPPRSGARVTVTWPRAAFERRTQA